MQYSVARLNPKQNYIHINQHSFSKNVPTIPYYMAKIVCSHQLKQKKYILGKLLPTGCPLALLNINMLNIIKVHVNSI